MRRIFFTSAAVSVLMFGLASAALARTGEYQSMDAMMLVHGQAVHTNCSFMAMIGGKGYCFGSEQSMHAFMERPRRNIRKADRAFGSIQ
jgi:YHS domain-containing protein